jgi:hypothetical protein
MGGCSGRGQGRQKQRWGWGHTQCLCALPGSISQPCSTLASTSLLTWGHADSLLLSPTVTPMPCIWHHWLHLCFLAPLCHDVTLLPTSWPFLAYVCVELSCCLHFPPTGLSDNNHLLILNLSQMGPLPGSLLHTLKQLSAPLTKLP